MTTDIVIVVCAVRLDCELAFAWCTRNSGAFDIASREGVSVAIGPVTERQYRCVNYSPAKASNIGIRRAARLGHRVIIKTDIDCIMSPELLRQANALDDAHGICPLPKFVDVPDGEGEYQVGPCGTMALTANTWTKLCGYDERQWGHGYEDGDLSRRASNSGVHVDHARGLLEHVAHESRQDPAWYPRRAEENLEIVTDQGPWACEDWGLT